MPISHMSLFFMKFLLKILQLALDTRFLLVLYVGNMYSMCCVLPPFIVSTERGNSLNIVKKIISIPQLDFFLYSRIFVVFPNFSNHHESFYAQCEIRIMVTINVFYSTLLV